jgi:hypothetical protein
VQAGRQVRQRTLILRCTQDRRQVVMIAEVRAVTALEAGAARAFVPTRERPAEEECEPEPALHQPGSQGEHILQERLGTAQRAQQFYDKQVVDYLTPVMAEFIQRMEMAFIATSDPDGECDCSFRAGAPGFIRVIDEKTIAYPELRGNGVMASLGNMLQNPHIGIFFVDFSRDLIGLHVNGDASIVSPARMLEFNIEIDESENAGKKPVQWVLIHVTEAYIHCSKHIPLLVPQSRVRHWGTDNPRHKGGDYFGVTAIKTEAGLIAPRRRGAPAPGPADPADDSASLATANGSTTLLAPRGSALRPQCKGAASRPHANGSSSPPTVNGSASPHH